MVAEFEFVVKIEVVPLLEVKCPIFGGSGPLLCTKFGCSSRSVGSTGSATTPKCFLSNFTFGECYLAKIFGALKLSEVHLERFSEYIYQIRLFRIWQKFMKRLNWVKYTYYKAFF